MKTGLQRLIEGECDPGIPAGGIALLANPSAMLSDGTPASVALLRAGYDIVRLFAPEHGVLGLAQDAVPIPDDTHHGVEVVSLYGPRSTPDAEHMADLHAVVIDIQDIGCRYYTYAYSAAALIEACARDRVPAFVLDRPNPIGGIATEGGPIEKAFESEVGRFGLIQRHAMTIGEICRYVGDNYFPEASVTVVPLANWARAIYYPQTGLPWKPPSPNLPTPDCAMVYPGTSLFEGTNISEGRGTTHPFEIVGAPWIDAQELRDFLAERSLPGVAFSPASFVPTFSKFAGEICHGTQLHVTDWRAFQPLRTGIELLLAVRNHSRGRFRWRPLWEDPRESFFDRLAGSPAARAAIDRGAGVQEVYSIVTGGDRRRFDRRRAAALLYEEPCPPPA